MKATIKVKGKEMILEILTIDEAVKARYLTNQEGIEHHTWHKDVNEPVDEKRFIYVDGIFAGISDNKIDTKDAQVIAKETIDFLS